MLTAHNVHARLVKNGLWIDSNSVLDWVQRDFTTVGLHLCPPLTAALSAAAWRCLAACTAGASLVIHVHVLLHRWEKWTKFRTLAWNSTITWNKKRHQDGRHLGHLYIMVCNSLSTHCVLKASQEFGTPKGVRKDRRYSCFRAGESERQSEVIGILLTLVGIKTDKNHASK